MGHNQENIWNLINSREGKFVVGLRKWNCPK